MLCDFWGYVFKVPCISALISWDTHTWYPAIMPWGSPSSDPHERKPGRLLETPVGFPAYIQGPICHACEWAILKQDHSVLSWTESTDNMWNWNETPWWATAQLQIYELNKKIYILFFCITKLWGNFLCGNRSLTHFLFALSSLKNCQVIEDRNYDCLTPVFPTTSSTGPCTL